MFAVFLASRVRVRVRVYFFEFTVSRVGVLSGSALHRFPIPKQNKDAIMQLKRLLLLAIRNIYSTSKKDKYKDDQGGQEII